MSLRVLIAEDHLLVSQGLEVMLSEEDVELVGVVDTGDQAVTRSQAESADIVLMDVNLGKSMSGIEATRLIKEQNPDTKVLVLTFFTDPGTVAEAVMAGADGYLSKSASREAVVQAIYDVAEGRAVLDPNVTEGILVAEHIHVSEKTVKTYLKQIFQKLGVHEGIQWNFDLRDPRNHMTVMLLFLALLVVVVAWSLWRLALPGF